MNNKALLEADLEQQSSSVGWLASYQDGRTSHGRDLCLLDNLGESLPAKADDAFCSVIFDGVLYNRKELSDNSSSSLTENDAAIVLKAYRRWGEELLHKIKGIFALIIQDRERDVLLGARDPVGVYPLFYASVGREWLFSTSVETLTRHPRVSSEINRAALVDHLCHGWPDIEETVFKNVKRVLPGHIIRVGRAKQVSRYWEPVIPGAGVDWVREDELERFDELLDQAVERSLGLGPAAIYLSGGLDSVSVAAVATKNSQRKGLLPPLALSLGFPAECDEEKIQRSVAADLGLPQVFMTIGEAVGPDGLLTSALEMTSHRSMPMLNLWNPAYHRLGLEGKQRGCRAILTGGGGDEWLGVTPFLAADLIRALNVVGLYQLWSTMQRSFPVPWHLMIKNALWTFGAKPLLGAAKRATIGRVLRSVAPGLLHARQKRRAQRTTPDWVAPDPGLKEQIDQRLEKRLEQTEPMRARGGFYFRELWRSLDHPLTAMEMEEVFESGTRMGLRILMPYWDVDLLEMLYRVPPDLLNKGGRSKGLVRQSLARKFPELGFDRQKKVVTINFFDSTLLQDGKKAWKVMGGTPALVKLGIVDEERLAATMAELFTGNQPRQAYRIWDVLNLEAWLRPRL